MKLHFDKKHTHLHASTEKYAQEFYGFDKFPPLSSCLKEYGCPESVPAADSIRSDRLLKLSGVMKKHGNEGSGGEKYNQPNQ